jgi:anti-anti-sigma factor
MSFEAAQTQSAAPGGFSVRTDNNDAAAVLRVVGEVDLVTAPELEESIKRELERRPEVLVVDLSGVSFLASVGMSVLIATNQQIGDATRLRLVATGNATLRPMELTGIAAEFSIYRSLDEALAGG